MTNPPTSKIRAPLQRFYGVNDLHFVTFSCYHRRPYLASARAKNRLVEILDEIRTRHGFRLVGYVVMPEHIHLLITEPPNTNPSKVLQAFKQKFSRESNEQRSLLSPDRQASETGNSPFWQRRFYDFNVWSKGKMREKLNYMHANPVRRKLALHPRDWPWSSWSFHEKGEPGLIRIDPI